MKKSLLVVVLTMGSSVTNSYFGIQDNLEEQLAKKSRIADKLWLDQEKRRDVFRDIKVYSSLRPEQEETFIQLYKWLKNIIKQEGEAVGLQLAIQMLDTFALLTYGELIELPEDDALPYYEELLTIFDNSSIKTNEFRQELCQVIKMIIENQYYK